MDNQTNSGEINIFNFLKQAGPMRAISILKTATNTKN